MRKSRLHWLNRNVVSTLLLLLLACACDTSIKTDEAEVGEALEKPTLSAPPDTLAVDTAKSEVSWIGSKMTGRHNGTFRLQSGELQLLNGELAGGTVVIDIASLQSTDNTIGEESNKKLSTHLKSPDFFDAERYPLAVFDIVSVAPYDSTAKKEEPGQSKVNYSELKIKNPTHVITGNLSIKDKVKSVTFPARITHKQNEFKARANFNIDRTKWGLVYRSDESLGDKTIYSNVNLGFEIIAKLKTQKPADGADANLPAEE